MNLELRILVLGFKYVLAFERISPVGFKHAMASYASARWALNTLWLIRIFALGFKRSAAKTHITYGLQVEDG
ncbi:MAG: hypothetical protein QXT14_02975 [Candidatus Bathyarchaeia archaeon]